LRGSEFDVFDRFQQASTLYKASYFYRICADNPFLEPEFLDRLAEEAVDCPGLDYISFADDEGRPVIKTHYGFFAELIAGKAFRKMAEGGISAEAHQHVTPQFYDASGAYRIHLLPMDPALVNPRMRLTVDTQEDLNNIRKIVAELGTEFHIQDVYRIVSGDTLMIESMESLIRDQRK
jgi:spore coat polysaccharide biosynthesis protein SpsF